MLAVSSLLDGHPKDLGSVPSCTSGYFFQLVKAEKLSFYHWTTLYFTHNIKDRFICLLVL